MENKQENPLEVGMIIGKRMMKNQILALINDLVPIGNYNESELILSIRDLNKLIEKINEIKI
jgi:hypothetical protein